jgi:hypothetical protein
MLTQTETSLPKVASNIKHLNTHDRIARCLKGSREAVIAEIMEWIDKGSDNSILWLTRPAGSGKSAIAQTVAEFCSKHSQLAADLFILQRAGDRCDFAHEIASILPSAEACIENDRSCILPSVRYRGHSTQSRNNVLLVGAWRCHSPDFDWTDHLPLESFIKHHDHDEYVMLHPTRTLLIQSP